MKLPLMICLITLTSDLDGHKSWEIFRRRWATTSLVILGGVGKAPGTVFFWYEYYKSRFGKSIAFPQPVYTTSFESILPCVQTAT